MANVRAGKLRHRVSLQHKTQTQNPNTGAIEYTWVELAKLWARIEPLSAREFIAAQSTQSKVTARITIRHRQSVDATMRVVHRGRIYNIEGVLPDPESGIEHITLPVSEGVTDGS